MEKPKKKYPIKTHLAISLLATIAAYLIASFVKWDFTFILKLPHYETEVRGLIIFLYLCAQIFITLIIDTNYRN